MNHTPTGDKVRQNPQRTFLHGGAIHCALYSLRPGKVNGATMTVQSPSTVPVPGVMVMTTVNQDYALSLAPLNAAAGLCMFAAISH